MRNTYKLLTDSVGLALTTTEVNAHLKTNYTDIATDVYMSLLVKTVQKVAEKYTGRDFLTKTWLCLANGWTDYIQLRRSPLQSITSITYINKDEVTQTLDSSKFDILERTEYSSIVFNSNMDYPTLSDKPQPITIEFLDGYGTEADIPQDLKLAMLQHLAMLWENRGDCVNCDTNSLDTWIKSKIPQASILIYSMYRILEIVL